MLSGEVHSRGPQYIHKDEAVANLLKEVQGYLLTYKRVENHKIVAKMNPDHINPDIVWYIERPDEREHEITIYKVVEETVPGWWGNVTVKKIERHIVFSVMDLPNRPINIPGSKQQEKTYLIPDTPRSSKPSVTQDELMDVLRKAVEQRKEKLDQIERQRNMTPLQKAVEERRKVIESQDEEWK